MTRSVNVYKFVRDLVFFKELIREVTFQECLSSACWHSHKSKKFDIKTFMVSILSLYRLSKSLFDKKKTVWRFFTCSVNLTFLKLHLKRANSHNVYLDENKRKFCFFKWLITPAICHSFCLIMKFLFLSSLQFFSHSFAICN